MKGTSEMELCVVRYTLINYSMAMMCNMASAPRA
jgi:hypothetical protein